MNGIERRGTYGSRMKKLFGTTPGGWIGVLAMLWIVGASAPMAAQEARVTGSSVTLSDRDGGRSALELTLEDGSSLVVAFEGGTVRLDGEPVAEYEESGRLETSWREFLLDRAAGGGESLASRLYDWARAYGGPDGEAAAALGDRLARRLGVAESVAAAPEATTVTGPGGTELSIAPGGLAFDALTRQLERLQDALSQLGDAAAAATDRLALIVHDDYAVTRAQTIPGNLALVDGRLTVAGTVEGDILLLNGSLILEPSARVEGDILQVGGEVESLEGRVAGEILSLLTVAPVVAEVPEVETAPAAAAGVERSRSRPRRSFGGRVARNFGRALGDVIGTLGTFLGLGVLGLIAVYFARPKLEVVADTVRQEFGRSFAMGLAGEILFFPILLVLAVLVITWLVIPFYMLAAGMALAFGYLAVAHATGEIFANSRYRYQWLERLRRSNSYYYVVSGLALLLLPFALCGALWVFGGTLGFLRGLIGFAAVVGTWILMTSGFGAVLLTRAGTRPEYAGVGDWMPDPGGETATETEVEVEETEERDETSGGGETEDA